jgi:hypothetical protein
MPHKHIYFLADPAIYGCLNHSALRPHPSALPRNTMFSGAYSQADAFPFRTVPSRYLLVRTAADKRCLYHFVVTTMGRFN